MSSPSSAHSFTRVFHTKPYASIVETNPSLSARGKTVFVTGAGKGIGAGIALSFARAGAKAIVITGRAEDALARSRTAILDAGSAELEVQTFFADVLDGEVVRHAFEAAHAEFGPIDVLVANAGYASPVARVVDADLGDYWRNFDVNVRSNLIVAQAFLQVAAPNASLINISSGAAHLAYHAGFSGYVASKLAIWRVMDFVQLENPGVKVFNLQPGRVETDMSRKVNVPGRDDVGKLCHTLLNPNQGFGPFNSMRVITDTLTSLGLPSAFCVWLASGEADFLKGRMVWPNWDVDELKGRAEEIQERNSLTIELRGLD